MASLIKRKGSPFWFIQYRRPDRTWTKRSTGLKHSVSAETRKAREECARQTLKELTVSRVGGESRWDAWVLKFLEGRYVDRQKTLARYKTTWRTWMLYLDKLGLELPMQVTYVHCQEFIGWRKDPKTKGVYRCSQNTAVQDLRTFGLIMQEAMRRGFITTNPARGLGLVKTRPKEKPEINPIEEMRIRAELPKWPEWMGVAFEIAMATGCRLRETVIDLRNIDERAGTIHIIQKGNRPHTTALPPKLLPLIQRLRAQGRRTTLDMPHGASKDWRRFFRSIDLAHLSFHCTRVTVITRLARAGIPERHTMRFVGHSATTVHRVYTRLSVGDLKQCVQALESSPTVPATVT